MGDIFRLNDWPIRRFIILSLSLLISLDSIIVLNMLGVDIPLVRQIIGFIVLTFIPGYAILRILRVHNLDGVSSFMLSVGLSMFFIMLLGLFLNVLKDFLGIAHPLCLENLLLSINALYVILMLLSYKMDSGAVIDSNNITITAKSISFYGLIILFPILSILAGYLVYFYNIHVFVILLFAVFASLPIYISIKENKRENLIFLIWSMSLSLIFISTFGTSFNWLFIGDVNREYYVASKTLENFYWNADILSYNMNSMLVDVILSPAYKLILGIPLFVVFKLIYPFLFSLVPVAVYKVYINVYAEKDKNFLFFAIFLIVSTSVFYNGMIPLTRQMIAELYLVLVLLVIIIENSLTTIHKRIFSMIFGVSLIVSHYGTAYIFVSSIILSYIISYIIRTSKNKRIITTPTYVSLIFTLLVLWYIYTSRGAPFSTLVKVLYGILINELNKLLNPNAVQSLKIITEKLPLLHNITKYIILISQVGIGLGVLGQITKKARVIKANQTEFYILSLVYFGYDILAIIVPYAKFLNVQRVYHITQLFISIYFLGGVKLLYSILGRIFRKKKKRHGDKGYIDITVKKKQKITVAVFLSIYLLFNSGVAYFLGNSPPIFSYFDNSVDGPRAPISNVCSALWISNYKGVGEIYGDHWSGELLTAFINIDKVRKLRSNLIIRGDSYLYLRSYNIINKKVYISEVINNMINLRYFSLQKLYHKNGKVFNLVYNSERSKILLWE